MANPNPKRPDGFEKYPERCNRSGRPRKWTSQLKDFGYGKSEITDCLKNLIAMNEDELKEVITNSKATVLEVTVAGALIKGIQMKSLYNLELLLSRLYGQPKQEIEEKVLIAKFDVKFNDTDNIPKE